MHASLTTSRRVDVKGGRIHVQARDGDGPALVFLHYWGGSLRTWAPVVERLDPARAFAALDQRGWGESHGVPGPYGMERLADDAQQVVETLGYADYVVVGHSMGGKAAQVLAARRPTGLRGMVLVAPATPAPAGVTPELQDMISHAYDTTAAIDQSIGQMLTHGALSDAMRRQVHQDSSRAGREARLAWPLEGLVEDFSAAVAAIEVPVLVLAGSHDKVDPPQTLRDHLLPLIPTATLTVLDGPGHLSPLEAPAQIAHHVTAFLDGLRTP